MPRNIVVLLNSDDGRRLVRERCKAVGLPMVCLEQLIEAEIDQLGKKRKAGLWEEFDRILDGLDGEDR
jgi:hypothetical protein